MRLRRVIFPTPQAGHGFFPIDLLGIPLHKFGINFLVAQSAHSRSDGRVPDPERAALVSAAQPARLAVRIAFSRLGLGRLVYAARHP